MPAQPLAVVLALLTALIACAPLQRPQSDEAALLAADERHRRADVAGDVAMTASITHPRLMLNAPNNRVVTREEFLSLMRSGQLGTQSLQRVPEGLIVDGDIGLVMGRETVIPSPTSISGRMFGTTPQDRRYTNIYVCERGDWRLIGRHATVVPVSH